MGKVNTNAKNGRVSFAGKSIILDYEYSLHYYGDKEELIQQGLVLAEMYPYEGDILCEYLPVDSHFGVVSLEALYAWASKAIAEENLN